MQQSAFIRLGGAVARPGTRLESIEISLLLEGIARQWGYDFTEYAPASLYRRVRAAMEKERVETISALQERVLHDVDAMGRFIASMSVHVTSMFRDPDFYHTLRHHVVPILRTYPFVRVWNAGCSTGEEAYSLAIVFREEGILERSRIYATDLSEALVDRARRGIFTLDAVRKYAEAYRQSGGQKDFAEYFVSDDTNAIFKSHLRKNLTFSQHNLVSDGPFNEFNLVLCRNVMIYFNWDLRKKVLNLIDSSLARFGLLGLGKKESLLHTGVNDSYHEVERDSRIYRRIH